jgi:hypothetical protein
MPVNRGFDGGGRNFPPPKKPADRAGAKNSFERDLDVVASEPTCDLDFKD